ncbi:carbamoyl-phosphate synthase (glutamine-hydrolyzing) large subunit [Bacillus horti]|uniref:Carbamoyl phosphate synthase large chain n=1 Tax=Caldalkalibacillus horti TaxID=77523 RepID=A0ABT9W127_9BACI|nr:carbamoyl-phosphate synthase (glutamine-hydrolyzing) large subunit [Bacillus horti]MDQ0166545.1 carbamoyl-phosphate synthase large subunit [Bacillus horti]
MPLCKELKKVLVIGSGPIVIGQAAEFDYAGTQACLALKEEGIKVVLVNSNPATIMTDPSIADEVYIEPLTVQALEQIIAKEKPDGMIGTLGGQTGLNLTVKLYEQGILEKYQVALLGTSVESIKKGEDRDLFRSLMLEIGEPIPDSTIVHSVEEGVSFVTEVGFPVILRPAYTLGGEGGGFAYNQEELEERLAKALALSPIHQVLLEKSIKGWKEIEYEVMRDDNDTCIIVCNMENMDPVGVHTGDSIVVAPSQTLSDVQYQLLRNSSLKVIRALNIVGGCNIQFALHPSSNQYCIIEVNPRVSRSSALASKATGYPIARMAAKCAIGYHLDELINPITGNTYASFEPALDYIVVKLPRFPFDKFSEADRRLGTQMKATGEVMAIDRSFEAALQKGLRSLEMKNIGLHLAAVVGFSDEELFTHIEQATDLRIFALAEALRRGTELNKLHDLTQIDFWFLEKLQHIIQLEKQLKEFSWDTVPLELLEKAKRKNMSDQQLSMIYNVPEKIIRSKWQELDWKPSYKLVDTCAAEFEAVTPYYYSTWLGKDEVPTIEGKKVLVIGSGPIRIGQGIEFDYCSVHAALALKKKGYKAIVINNNPETVSTDYTVADRLYFEPLTVEDIVHIAKKEQAIGAVVQFGGQTALNVAQALEEEGVTLFGTSLDAIDQVEDRERFYALLAKLNIDHIEGQTVFAADTLKSTAQELGYPVLVRPSYVIGGQAMFIFYHEHELEAYIQKLEKQKDERIWPLLVDRYMAGHECELDAVSDGDNIVIPGIFEHIERAGVHSGDSTTIFPPLNLSQQIKDKMIQITASIARELQVVGLLNIQFVVQNEQVFVLEVNPRASRTVPIISKIMQVPLVEWATRVQLGEKVLQLSSHVGLLPEPDYYAIKSPVFSYSKLKGVDPVLGPEMKSTGEILALGKTVTEALEKGYETLSTALHGKGKATQLKAESYAVLCSIADREKKESLPAIKHLIQLGYRIVATENTARFLKSHHIDVEEVEKSKAVIHERLKKGDVKLILNIPEQGRKLDTQGFSLRESAIREQIPCYTCLDTLTMQLDNETDANVEYRSLNEYYELITVS